MQVRRLTIHDCFESEKIGFILNPLSDREPVEFFEKWSDTLKFVGKRNNFEQPGVSGCSVCSC